MYFEFKKKVSNHIRMKAKQVGIHICVVATSNPDTIISTLNSCRKTQLNIKSICVACDDTDTYMNILQGQDCKLLPMEKMSNMKQRMNSILRYYKNRVLLWLKEGELICGTDPIYITKESGILMRIEKNRAFSWEMRILCLRFPWYFEALNGEYPTLTSSQEYNRVTRRLHELIIIQPNISVSDTLDRLNDTHIDYFRMGSQSLLQGNLDIARDTFQKKIMRHKNSGTNGNKDHLIRCYLGHSICQHLTYSTWENIETTLQEAFRISKHASLEIAYFMIRFSRTREKGCLVIKYLEKYKEILYQINPPTESNVSYDMELYHYRCLVEWMVLCFENNYFELSLEAASDLRKRRLIPLEYRESIEYIYDLSKEQYQMYQDTQTYMDQEPNVENNISLQIERYGSIYIHSSQIKIDHVKCSIGTQNLTAEGVRFICDRCDNQNENDSIFQGVLENNLMCKGFIVMNKERLCYPIPWLVWNSSKSITDIRKKDYRDRSGHYTVQDKFDLNINKSLTDLDSRIESDRIWIKGTGKWIDIMFVVYCLLHGCMVFYEGKRDIAEVFYPKFNNEIYFVGGMSVENIVDVINKYTIEWSSRKLSEKADIYTFSKQCAYQLKIGKPILDKVHVIDVSLDKSKWLDFPLRNDQFRFTKPVMYHSPKTKIDKAAIDYIYWILEKVEDVDMICISLPIFVISLNYVKFKFGSNVKYRSIFTPIEYWTKDDPNNVTIIHNKSLAQQIVENTNQIFLRKLTKYYRVILVE